jgi:hypothetical protein
VVLAVCADGFLLISRIRIISRSLTVLLLLGVAIERCLHQVKAKPRQKISRL